MSGFTVWLTFARPYKRRSVRSTLKRSDHCLYYVLRPIVPAVGPCVALGWCSFTPPHSPFDILLFTATTSRITD